MHGLFYWSPSTFSAVLACIEVGGKCYRYLREYASLFDREESIFQNNGVSYIQFTLRRCPWKCLEREQNSSVVVFLVKRLWEIYLAQ